MSLKNGFLESSRLDEATIVRPSATGPSLIRPFSSFFRRLATFFFMGYPAFSKRKYTSRKDEGPRSLICFAAVGERGPW